MIIKNREILCSHGNKPGRTHVMDILEAGLTKTDPYVNAKKLIRIRGNQLIVGHEAFTVENAFRRALGSTPLTFDLSQIRNIYVVGGGKAAQRMAKAMEEVLGDRITDGCICAKKGEPVELQRIDVVLAGHPLPDEDSVAGAQRIFEIETHATHDDIVFVSESGGGTALMTLPGPGVTLEDIRDVTQMLYFECGASIMETNAVRSHLVLLRGRHSRLVGDATLIRFTTAPIPPGLGPYIRRYWGRRGYKGAIDVLKKYGLWQRVSNNIRRYLLKGDPLYSRVQPCELVGKPQYHFRVIGPEDMLEAAKQKAEALGITPVILTSSPDDLGAAALGGSLAWIALEIERYSRPFQPPCVLISGGELVVEVGTAEGMGGRNQEFVVSLVPRIASSEKIVAASVDSDGTDGPTSVAGGIVDGYSMQRALALGRDVFEDLREHNSYSLLEQLGDTVVTGARGTNVQDLRVVYIDD